MSELGTVTGKARGARRKAARPRLGLTILSLTAFALLIALGVWQIERRAWKLALIDRVEQRIHAPAQPAPSPASWPTISAANDEYRHVTVSGRFLHDRETLVQAVTEEGGGYWVLTPLRRDDGTVVLVNRGFVPPEARERGAARTAAEPVGETTVAGLLRLTEPHGGFLRKNDPAQARWYSRDVQAIAAARGLDAASTAPYFLDAEATAPRTGDTPAWPAPGLTIIAFPNSHLVYAITWYALALMVAVGFWYVRRDDARRRRTKGSRDPEADEPDDNAAHADDASPRSDAGPD